MSRPQLRILLAMLLAAAPAAAVRAQDAQTGDEVPERRVTQPGKGPQIPFDEARWEFWFYFNREPLVRLRPALLQGAADDAGADVPFRAVTGEDREESLIPRLVAALRDQNPEVRAVAVQALAKTRDPAARPALFGALRDTQYLVRLSAVLGLGVWGNTVSLPRLEEMVRDDTRELQERMYAAVAMGLIGGPLASESFRQFLAAPAFKALPVIVQVGIAYGVGLVADPENAAQLRELLADRDVKDVGVRSSLILSLGKSGAAEDAVSLRELLRAEEVQSRRSAAIALGVLHAASGDQDTTSALVRAAHRDSDVMVRNFAYLSLGRVGGEAALRQLRTDLQEMTKVFRPFIALALGLAGDPESVPVLLRHFNEETDTSYRAALAVSLGLHRDLRGAPDLRKAFRSEGDPVFKGYLGLALGMLGDVESIPHLEKALETAKDVELIPNLATALGLLGSRSSAEKLVPLVERERNEFVKQSLLYSLGLIGDRDAVPALIGEVGGEDEVAYIRGYAVTGLGLLADPHEVRAIARASRDSNYTLETNSNFLRDLFMTL